MKFKLTKKERTEIINISKNYENSRASSIEALKIIQKNYGWISRKSIFEISKILRISECDIEEVATFYSQIFRYPVGKNVIKYCDSIVCYVNGCETIKYILEEKLNINIGETTKDLKFTLLPICCLGYCDKSPVVMINDDMYSNLTKNLIIKLLESYS